MSMVADRDTAIGVDIAPWERPWGASEMQVGVVEVTPAIAEEWLSPLRRYADQRPLNERRVDRLQLAMTADEFEPVDSVKLYTLDGREYLVDGQHRLTALVRWGGTLPMVVVRKVVHNRTDLNLAFGRLDRGQARTQIDALRGVGVHTQINLRLAEANCAASAYKVIASGFERPTKLTTMLGKNIDFLTRGVLEWQDEARRFYGCLEPGIGLHRKQLQRNVVMAIALVTLRYQPEVAEKFWTRVAVRDRLDAASGEWHLAELLSRSAQGLGGGTKTRSDYDLIRRTASAWNAFFNDRPLRCTTTGRTPFIKLAGTIYRGDQVHRITE